MHRKIRKAVHLLLAMAVLGLGAAGFYMLKSGKEALGRKPMEASLPLVRTVPAAVRDVQIMLTGYGTVHPVVETRIATQVSGRVVRVAEGLVNGGMFQKGDLLLAIEDADYRIAQTLARAGVREAQNTYQTAREESLAAISEWNRLHPDQPPPPLVAKKPQLEAALANLEAQRGNLEKARLNLKRTRIHAPFDCCVSAEQVDAGQYVTPGQALATLYATGAVEIVVPMESRDLAWFDAPGFNTDGQKGSPVRVTAKPAGGRRSWQGRVVRVQGRIDENTRMVGVVIRVVHPFKNLPPLVPGQFAEVRISGRTIPDAALIPINAIHENNMIWAVNPESGRLHIRKAQIAYIGEQGAVVRSGLEPGEHVAVSVIKGVTDGMKVRFVNISEKDGS